MALSQGYLITQHHRRWQTKTAPTISFCAGFSSLFDDHGGDDDVFFVQPARGRAHRFARSPVPFPSLPFLPVCPKTQDHKKRTRPQKNLSFIRHPSCISPNGVFPKAKVRWSTNKRWTGPCWEEYAMDAVFWGGGWRPFAIGRRTFLA